MKKTHHQRTGLVGGRRYTIGWLEDAYKRAERMEKACKPPSPERLQELQEKKRQLKLPGIK